MIKKIDKDVFLKDYVNWKSDSSQNRAILRIMNKLNEIIDFLNSESGVKK